MRKIKNFFKKIWGWLKYILSAIVGIIVLITIIKIQNIFSNQNEIKKDKLLKKNKNDINKIKINIKKEKEEIKKDEKIIDNAIDDLNNLADGKISKTITR